MKTKLKMLNSSLILIMTILSYSGQAQENCTNEPFAPALSIKPIPLIATLTPPAPQKPKEVPLVGVGLAPQENFMGNTLPISIKNNPLLLNGYRYLHQGDIQEAIWNFEEGKLGKFSENLKLRLFKALTEEEIIEGKPLTSTGKHAAIKVKLKNGIVGLFKPKSFDPSMSVDNEVAAYLLSNHLGLNLVPMTVVRNYNGVLGSLQYWINNSHVAISLPEEKRVKTQNLMFFDYLIRGTDRNDGNYLYKDDRLVAIDHGWTFRPWDLYHQAPHKNLWDLDKGKYKNYLPDPAIIARLREVTDQSIVDLLSPYLNSWSVNDVVSRKNELLRKIDKHLDK